MSKGNMSTLTIDMEEYVRTLTLDDKLKGTKPRVSEFIDEVYKGGISTTKTEDSHFC